MNTYSAEDIKSFYNNDYVKKIAKQTINKNKRLLKYIHFKKTDSIIDFGCGDGRFALLVHEKIDNYTGVDFSEDFIKKAKNNIFHKNINNVYFICEDIVSFCKKNPNSFDKAFAFDFTEHVYNKELKTILESIRNSLKPNGILYIHTPNGKYFIELLKKFGIMKQFPEHIAVRNSIEYLELLNEIGFSNIKVKFISHYILFLKFLHFLSYIPFLGEYFKARIFILAKSN